MQIPVSKLSFKIILKEYGPHPAIDARDILFQQLSYPSYNHRAELSKTSRILTERIDIRVASKINRKNPNIYQVGLNLNRYHLDRMMNFIYAQVLVEVSATGALEMFYDLNDLTDDDYDSESAYRRWQRFYQRKKQENDIKRIQQNRLINCKKGGYVQIPAETQEVEAKLSDFIFQNTHLFIMHKNRFDKIMLKQLKIYFYNYFALKQPQAIAAELNVNLFSVYHAIRKVRDVLEYDPSFKKAWQRTG